jgi:hypothetical protein
MGTRLRHHDEVMAAVEDAKRHAPAGSARERKVGIADVASSARLELELRSFEQVELLERRLRPLGYRLVLFHETHDYLFVADEPPSGLGDLL